MKKGKQPYLKTYTYFIGILWMCCYIQVSAQEIPVKDSIYNYLKTKKIEKAYRTLQNHIDYYKNSNQLDSLATYIYLTGKIESARSSTNEATLKATSFLNEVLASTTSKKTQSDAYLNLSLFYDEIGENKKSFEVTEQSLKAILQYKNVTPEEIGKITYNLGVTAQMMGKNDTAKKLFKDARRAYESYPKTSHTNLSKVYNATAVMYYLSSKLDSAQQFYKKAAKASLNNTEGDAIENLMDANVINSNVMLVQYVQGNISEALKTLEDVIVTYNTIIEKSLDPNTKNKAARYKANSLTNLAVIYNEIGNVNRANEILLYTLYERKKTLEPDNIQLANILVQLGQNQLSLQEYDTSITTLQEAIAKMERSTNENMYWKAAAFYAMAEAYRAKNELEAAKRYYELSEPLFESSLEKEYDVEFLGFLRNKALFFAHINEHDTAIKAAFKGYTYLKENNNTDNLIISKSIQNIAQVYYTLKDLQNAKKWSLKGLDVLNANIETASNAIDSIQIAFKKPGLLLLEAKIDYKITQKKEPLFLEKISENLSLARKILEKRKTISYTKEDINLIIDEYKSIVEFEKQILLELYQKTNNSNYLDTLLSLHESSIYNRIRNRLSLVKDISFNHVPSAILKREKDLKEHLSESLNSNTDTGNGINTYFETSKNWNTFLDSLKTLYPKYYKMRYGSISEDLTQIQQTIPEDATLVRYIFIKDQLFAFIISKKRKEFIPLDFSKDNKDIVTYNTHLFDEHQTCMLSHKLYKKLWHPLESKIATKKIIIIPDGNLFNLSFESLSRNPISRYRDFKDNSLLKKYTLSYHFSVSLTQQNHDNVLFKNSYIAFAPTFTSQMKDAYKLAITDTLQLDKGYLKLLSQPFNKEVIKEYTLEFDGTSYLNEQASKQIFLSNANEHKIIHIGTHAESNNINPELSRLIFAKNNANDTLINDNSLYSYEIYNQSLSSDLAILTACETGKPSYQSGEGMISLSHAFTYAGSKSILTSLWKIDEKSSAEIVSYFYKNLQDGMSKDVALQQAKLRYLDTAKGRTLAPQYWAGLVLVGETTAITLETPTPTWLYFLAGLVLLGILFFLIRKKQ